MVECSMPRRNTRKPRRRRLFYHVYNRARDGRLMFMDDLDRAKFLSLFHRYLSTEECCDPFGRPFAKLFSKVHLITFALMPNHFHLIVFQLVPGGLEDLMARVMNAYVKYFNARHGTSGPMFDGEYRADPKFDRRAQLNAIAYVHDNHADRCRCSFCGQRFFASERLEPPSWLNVDRGLTLFGDRPAYRRFRRARHALRDVTADSYV
jgi:hypothetical protein